ncbi:hypothetical protein [Clostridium beijerinckii]|uniref:hypothetical protein n=1 Tax=Clostridium beijerinckii TaxID=1520 RepID=UPI00098C3DC5|nr:hypothetical protein [Clostridium beijerinckii]NRT76318.1 hypothetical protein [Clostridium beijerinckii]OOM48645.1 hypothetical protein CBEIJ_21170 [Clostridium beijerinckii]
MDKPKRKKLKLNIKFNKGIVVCAKSPIECRSCRNLKSCETIDTYYYIYRSNDIEECFKNNYKKR